MQGYVAFKEIQCQIIWKLILKKKLTNICNEELIQSSLWKKLSVPNE
jgi:hypothetical protein